MTTKKPELLCLNCEKSELETPLLHLHYSGEELWICPQCLPTLIHISWKDRKGRTNKTSGTS